MAQTEIYQAVSLEDEVNNTIGTTLALPKFFTGLIIECELSGTSGRAGTWHDPEEYPELYIDDLVITHIEDEDGVNHKITKKQSKMLEHMIDDGKFEEQCWDAVNDMASTSQYDSWEYKFSNTDTNDWM